MMTESRDRVMDISDVLMKTIRPELSFGGVMGI